MRRIAIVDDDQMWIQMNRTAMESRGLIVESYLRPSQIIEAIDSKRIEFDVIVIGLMMPKD